MSDKNLWRQTLGLVLVVLLLAGCGGTPSGPDATLTPIPSTSTPTLVPSIPSPTPTTPSPTPTSVPTNTPKPTITPLPFIEGTKFPTGTLESEDGVTGVEFREDGTSRWYFLRDGVEVVGSEVHCKYGVNGNLYSEMTFPHPGVGRKVPVTYFWTYDGNSLTFQLWGVDLRPDRKRVIDGKTFIFVLESDTLSEIDAIEFPTGRFVSEDGIRAFEFDKDGIWRFFEDNLEHPALSGKYVSNGKYFTEMTHDDPDYREVPATYTWTYDGQKLTFELWGEDVNDHRESVYNQQTYTRVDE